MKKMVNKIVNYGNKILLIFTIGCFLIALFGAIFCYVNRSHNYLNPLLLIVGAIVYLIAISRLYKFIIKLNQKRKKVVIILLLIFHFVLLLASTFVISSIPKVDLLHILTEINSLNNTGKILNNTYYSVYPNNRFLLIILYYIQKIIPINSNILFSIISSLSITISNLFTYKIVKRMYDENKGLLSLFICVFSPIFYLYVSYYYTDVLMLPFASILLYLIIQSKDKEGIKYNIVYGIFIGIVAIVGYKIRAVAIFLLIAYFVFLIMSEKIMFMIKKFIPIIVSVILTIFCINNIENKVFTDVDLEKEFPMTHWIMMGVNKDHKGYYSQDDYLLSRSAKTIKERKELNLQKINDRLDELGFVGSFKLIIRKINTVWGKGDYSYQKYLDLVNDYNVSYRYLLEDKNIVINYLLQFSKIGVLVLAIMALINLLKSGEKSIIAISLFGAVVFYLVWEVCPRYGFSFLPWVIILGSHSYDILEFDFEHIKFYKYLKYGLLVMTCILFGVGFYKYTNIDLRSNIVAKDTVNKIKYIKLNKEMNVTQSLKLNSEFNEIKIKFKINKRSKKSSYKLKLVNDDKKVEYEKRFSTRELVNDGFTTFSLDKTYEKGTYYIELSSEADNSLEVYTSYKQEFDFYPKGNLKVNGIEEAGDLMFEIRNNQKRGKFTYLEYILIFCVSIWLEHIVLFRKKEKINEK